MLLTLVEENRENLICSMGREAQFVAFIAKKLGDEAFLSGWFKAKERLRSFRRRVHSNAQQFSELITEAIKFDDELKKQNKNGLIAVEFERIVVKNINGINTKMKDASKILTSEYTPPTSKLTSLDSNGILQTLPELWEKMNAELEELLKTKSLEYNCRINIPERQIEIPGLMGQGKGWVKNKTTIEFKRIGNFEPDKKVLNIRCITGFFKTDVVIGALGEFDSMYPESKMQGLEIKTAKAEIPTVVKVRRDLDLAGKERLFDLKFNGDNDEETKIQFEKAFNEHIQVIAEQTSDPPAKKMKLTDEEFKKMGETLELNVQGRISTLLIKEEDIKHVFDDCHSKQYFNKFVAAVKEAAKEGKGNVKDRHDMIDEKMKQTVDTYEEFRSPIQYFDCCLIKLGCRKLWGHTFIVTDEKYYLTVDGRKKINNFTHIFHEKTENDEKEKFSFKFGFACGELIPDPNKIFDEMMKENSDKMSKFFPDAGWEFYLGLTMELKQEFLGLYNAGARNIELTDLQAWKEAIEKLSISSGKDKKVTKSTK